MQVFMQRGNSSSDVIFTIGGNEIFKGRGNSSADVICTIKGNAIYKGRGSSSADVICTISGNEAYRGRGNSSADVICTIKENEIYKGRGNSSADVICTINGNEAYRGRGNSSGDVIFNTTEKPDLRHLIAILFLLDLIGSSRSTPSQKAAPGNNEKSSISNASNPKDLGEALAKAAIANIIKPLLSALLMKIKEYFKRA